MNIHGCKITVRKFSILQDYRMHGWQIFGDEEEAESDYEVSIVIDAHGLRDLIKAIGKDKLDLDYLRDELSKLHDDEFLAVHPHPK